MRMIYPGEGRTQGKKNYKQRPKGKKKKYDAFKNFKWWSGLKIFTLNYSHKI